MEYSVHEAKTQFSKLLAAVAQGEEVVITSGRARKRIARLSRVEEPKKSPLGFARDILSTPLGPEFWDPLPEEELRLWNGEGD
jgi:prevent-host-death family protein